MDSSPAWWGRWLENTAEVNILHCDTFKSAASIEITFQIPFCGMFRRLPPHTLTTQTLALPPALRTRSSRPAVVQQPPTEDTQADFLSRLARFLSAPNKCHVGAASLLDELLLQKVHSTGSC